MPAARCRAPPILSSGLAPLPTCMWQRSAADCCVQQLLARLAGQLDVLASCAVRQLADEQRSSSPGCGKQAACCSLALESYFSRKAAGEA